MATTTSYWGKRGRHQVLADKLNEMVPAVGSVKQPRKNPALERFRKASNAYYEIFNNGCINGAHGMKAYFGIEGTYARRLCHLRAWGRIHCYTEPAMDEIVMAAAVEQGLVEPEPIFRSVRAH